MKVSLKVFLRLTYYTFVLRTLINCNKFEKKKEEKEEEEKKKQNKQTNKKQHSIQK